MNSSVVARWRRAERAHGVTSWFTFYDAAAAAVFVAILAVAVVPRFDTDFWWHLFTGRHILASGVPTKDFLSYTAPGRLWVDHEWLTEVGMYLALQLGGFKLLFGLFGLLTAGAFLIVFHLMKGRGVHPALGLVLILMAAFATVGMWGPRVQIVSLVLAGVFCTLLERYRQTGEVRWLAGILIVMVVWANLHGGFAVGLLLIGSYFLGGVFDRVKEGMSWRQAVRRQRPLLLTLGGAVVMTFLTPGTYHTALYPLRFLTPNAFTNRIAESQSPNFHLYQLLPFELLLLGLVVGALLARRRVSWIDVLVAVGFTHLALQQTRNVALWCIVVLPIVAYYVQEAVRPLSQGFGRLNRPVPRASLPIVNWVVLLGVVVAGIAFVGRADSTANVLAAERQSVPSAAVAYLNAHPPLGHGFNSYSFGGYLIWATDGAVPVFIDSRADTVYSDRTLGDYLAMYNARPAWHRLFNRFAITWALVEPAAPVAAVLAQTDGWHRVFWSHEAVIYERG